MNFLAFPLFLVIWACLSLAFFIVIQKKKPLSGKEKFLFLSILLAAVLIQAYFRFGLTIGNTILASDEIGLEQNFFDAVTKGINTTHGSGPGFLLFVETAIAITGLDYGTIKLLLNFLFPPIIVFTVFVFFKSFFKDFRLSFMATLLLFLSSYFIWPLIELKPQQAGFVVFLVYIIWIKKFFETQKTKEKNATFASTIFELAAYIVLSIFLFFVFGLAHILSLVIFIPVLIAITLYFFCFKQGKKRTLAPMIAAFLSFVVFFAFFSTIWDIHFALRETMGFRGKTSELAYPFFIKLHVFPGDIKFSFFLFIPIITLAILSTMLAFLLRALKKPILPSLGKKINRLMQEKNFYWAAAAILLFLFSMQVALHYDDILGWYNNILQFAFLNLPNLALALAAITGFFEAIKHKPQQTTIPIILAVSLAALFLVLLIAGFFLRAGFGNFEIRTMQYMVVIAAFFASLKIDSILPKKQKLVILAFVLLFPMAFLSGTRDPDLFQRNAFQSNEEVAQYTLLDKWMEKFMIRPLEIVCIEAIGCKRNLFFHYGFENNELAMDESLDKVFTSSHRSVYLSKGRIK